VQWLAYYRAQKGPHLQDFSKWPGRDTLGQCFRESVAELPVFDGGPFPASALAVEEAEIAFILRRDFQAHCMEHLKVSLKVLKVVGARLRRLIAIIEELSFSTIRPRLIAALVKLP
jgi:CRP/FNR family transcriptional regulator